MCSAPAASEELGAKHVTVPNPNKFSLSATALSENQMRAKVCEARDGEALSFGGQCGTVPNRRYERSVSEVNEAICDCTGGKVQTGAIVACDEQGTKHYESAVASKASEQIFDLTGGKVQKSFAFTLSELLMSVLVVSIILVAMAPVITKRTSDNISTNAVKYEGKLYTYNPYQEGCEIEKNAAGKELNRLKCDFEVPDDVHNINIVAVSGGGGGGASDEFYIFKGSKTIVGDKDARSFLKLTHSIKNLNIVDFYGAGGGGGGTHLIFEQGVAPSSQEDCDMFNTVYVELNSSKKTGICMTKYNAGDPGGPSLPSDIVVVKPDEICYDNNSKCCWQGEITAGTCTSDPEYSGCNRTLCQAYANSSACGNYNVKGDDVWSHLTKKELDAVNTPEKRMKLNFCSADPLDGFIQCADDSAKCLTATGSSFGCLPSVVHPWATTSYYGYRLSSAGWIYKRYDSGSKGISSSGSSVRCALRKINQKFSIAYGGFGAGSTSIVNMPLSNDFIKQYIGKYLVLKAYKVGDDKIAKNSSDKDVSPTSGYPAVYFKDAAYDVAECRSPRYQTVDCRDGLIGTAQIFIADNFLSSSASASWGYEILPGAAGGAGILTKSSYYSGIGGTGVGSSKPSYKELNYGGCVKLENGAWEGSCEDIMDYIHSPLAGTNGAIYPNKYGRPSKYSYKPASQDDTNVGKTYTSSGGYNLVNTGKPGEYTAYLNVDTGVVRLEETKPTLGHPAKISIQYDDYEMTGSGAGGGSGLMVEKKNLQVDPHDVIAIRVGNGGAGAKISNIEEMANYKQIYFSSAVQGGISGFDCPDGTKCSGQKIHLYGGRAGGSGEQYFSDVDNPEDALGQPVLNNIIYCNSARKTVPYGTTFNCDGATIHTGNAGSIGGYFVKDGEVVASYGGKGGDSPTGAKGGCGGLNMTKYLENPSCTNISVDGESVQFSVPTYVGSSFSYGSAGAGGGGAGWDFDNYDKIGKGGDGQPGYVYVYWVKVE